MQFHVFSMLGAYIVYNETHIQEIFEKLRNMLITNLQNGKFILHTLKLLKKCVQNIKEDEKIQDILSTLKDVDYDIYFTKNEKNSIC